MKSRRLISSFCLVVILAAGQELPSAGREKSSLAFAGSALWTKAHDIMIQGNLGYCAFLNGLVILDLTDLKKPALLSQLYLGGGYSIAVREQTAFVASGKEGLKIIDVSDPKSPVLKAKVDTDGEARDVGLNAAHAFVADGPGGLVVLDVRNPAAPKVVGSCAVEDFANGVAVDADFAYVTDTNAGIKKIDIRDPAAPRLIASFDTPGEATSPVLAGEFIIVPDAFSLLIIKQD